MRERSLQVEQWPITQLLPYAQNARTHSDEQLEQIAASIARFGFNQPILVNQHGVVIAGHGRLLAAQRLAMDKVPTIVLPDLTDTDERAYRLADNQLALNAGWDQAMLAAEIAALRDTGLDLSVLGFNDRELDLILTELDAVDGEGASRVDAIPPLSDQIVARHGDTWQLGRHRIRCGDATTREDVEALLDGAQPVLMVTDPPYGVQYDPMWRAKVRPQNVRRAGVQNDDRVDWEPAFRLFPGPVAYIWHESMGTEVVWAGLRRAGFEIRTMLVWVKNRLVLGRGDYHWQHELCAYAVRAGCRSNWQGDRTQTTTWMIPVQRDVRVAENDPVTEHGTQKPIECMRRPIVNNTARGESVYDPFVGSGTTIVAAETTGRNCYAMEIEPRYVDVAIRRWQSFTGGEAVLLQTGESWPAVERKRLAEQPAPGAAESATTDGPAVRGPGDKQDGGTPPQSKRRRRPGTAAPR